MGSKTKNSTHHRSRIIDHFLAKFKKAVNSATLPDKVPLEPPMASLMNPAALLAPPTALPHNPPVTYRSSIATALLNGQNRYSSESHASSITSNRSVTESEQSASSYTERSSTSSDETLVERRDSNDFIFGKIIGEGSFSTVYLAKDIHTRREYAIKVCNKNFIIREKKVEQIRREREILALLSSRQRETAPFFVKIYSSFQDSTRLYFVLTYAKNGELFSHIDKVGSFDLACTRFYAGEILHALEHMHSLGIVHRDLKPENILLDENMHIQITDFGSGKILAKSDETDGAAPNADSTICSRRHSFVGTAQYISPELLKEKSESTRACDLWAFGAIIYQMVAGKPPFRASSEYLIFRKIKNLDYEFPDGFNPTARDLVGKLFVLDPTHRLGSSDGDKYTSIREHPFFEGVDIEKLYKQTPPAIYPYLPGSSAQEELRSHYRVPDHLEPGLDDRQITRLLGLELSDTMPLRSQSPEPVERRQKSLLGLASLTPEETERRLAEQKVSDPRWHALCCGNLILKRGLVIKKKGLFSRRRMLMLTTGPHLYYANPENMTVMGEIPWCPELRAETKTFKIFFVHTPNRTYYLHDPDGYALDWVKAIEEMRIHTYGKKT